MKITEFTFAGVACKAAPPAFTEDVCDLVELLEESDECREQDKKFRKNGRMLKLIRKVGKECLVRGGHTPDEAEEIMLKVSMDEDKKTGIPAIANALGVV